MVELQQQEETGSGMFLVELEATAQLLMIYMYGIKQHSPQLLEQLVLLTFLHLVRPHQLLMLIHIISAELLHQVIGRWHEVLAILELTEQLFQQDPQHLGARLDAGLLEQMEAPIIQAGQPIYNMLYFKKGVNHD